MDEPKSLSARKNVQEWSKARLLQIQDLLNWELEKLTQDLVLAHEQFLGMPPVSMRGPSSKQSSIPKISQAIEETLEPSFDEGETTSTASRNENPSPCDLEIKVSRNSWRKRTPFLKASDLADLQSEESESSLTASKTLQQGGLGMRLSKGSLQSSALVSSETEGMEVISAGETVSADSGACGSGAPQELLEVITDKPGENSSSVSSFREVKENSLPSSLSPQMKRLQSGHESKGQDSMFRSRRSSARQTRLARLVRSQFFDISFSVLIMVNCVTMGMQADSLVNDYNADIEAVVWVAENILVFLFTFEIAARLKVFGCAEYFDMRTSEGWFNVFDAIIVLVSGPIFGWVFPLIALITGESFSAGFLRTLSVFRSLRLLRIVRVIQRMPMFREVWLLLRGLTSSMRTLVWTVTVIFVLTYLFAILGCWIISSEIKQVMQSIEIMTPEEAQQITYTFEVVKGIAPLMQLLIQFLTLDSWNSKMEQIMKYTPWCVGYFYTYIAVAVFVLMNLVTAIIVENAMSASKMDENEKLKQMEDFKKKELKELEHLFYLMDADGDGTLDWEEFENAFLDEEMSRKWRLLDFGPDECKELFDLLDDGDGGIHTGEFFHGLARMKGGAQSRDLMKVGQQVDRISKDVQSLIAAWRLQRISSCGSMESPTCASETGLTGKSSARSADSCSDVSDPFAKPKKSPPKSPKLGIEEAKKRMAEAKRSTASTASTGGGVSPLQPLAKKEILQVTSSPSLASGFAGYASSASGASGASHV